MPLIVRATAVDRLRDIAFLVRHLFPKPIRKRIGNLAIQGLPSRRYMQTAVLPALAAAGCVRMLFVGAQSYNLPFYRDCVARGISVWTIDFDPQSATWGGPNGHFVGDICRVHELVGGLTFDVVIYNGILGFGINTAPDALRALESMSKVAEPSALILVGWNPGLTNDAEIEVMRPRLSPAMVADLQQDVEFAARGIQKNPHRYEMFRFPAGQV